MHRGSQSLEREASLRALDFRHAQDHTISPHATDVCECHACVSGCGLDERGTRLDLATTLGLPDHVEDRAVLDCDRVHELALTEDARPAALFHAIQREERRVADHVCDG